MRTSRGHGIYAAAAAVGLTAALVIAGGDSLAAFLTSVIEYATPVDPTEYEVKPLLSVGDTVPETSDPSKQYQMVGIPDGLGAHTNRNGRVTVYMNHELVNTVLSEPVIGEPLNRGAIVSKLIVDRHGNVISGERAYDTVHIDDGPGLPAAALGNDTRGFGRFCSGFLAGPEQGFDRYIYFANEEGGVPQVSGLPGNTPSPTLDPKGGLSIAIFDNEAHGLTDLGRFPWENTVVRPDTGRWTVIMGMEDGPASLNPTLENSQLYMYVGEKSRKKRATVLERNGLVGGTLYVFKSTTAGKNSELPFQDGTIDGAWVAIEGADAMSQAELEKASDDRGAMIFGRPEDGAFNPRNSREYFFVTTGGATGANALGRLYSLRLDRSNPAGPARLKVLYNADQIIDAGGDIALSPDNIDVSERYLMIQEDGTTESRAVMTSKNRDGSIWRFDLTGEWGIDVSSATRVVELWTPGRGPVAPTVGKGVWETSGSIDSDELFGRGSWLFDVQVHSPTPAPAANTVEDGQLLLLRPVRARGHDGDDRDDDRDDDHDGNDRDDLDRGGDRD